jgi:hypothetical protein
MQDNSDLGKNFFNLLGFFEEKVPKVYAKNLQNYPQKITGYAPVLIKATIFQKFRFEI